MLEEALYLASLGWRIVPLHGIRDDGTCTCGQGHDSSSNGKHPRGRDWGNAATCDEDDLIETLEKLSVYNIGILLGPKSGVVDIEFDTREGEKTAERMFAECVTPTYQSGRSVHRLFKWNANLPAIQKRIVSGLECRLGGGGRATMSVIPPSKHHSGVLYQWLPGLSPRDCELADLPDDLMLMITNDEDPHDQPKTRISTRGFEGQKIQHGERNNTMLQFAERYAFRSPDISDMEEQGHLWELMRAYNHLAFDPPLDEQELARVHGSACRYRARITSPAPCETRQTPSDASQVGGWVEMGLEWDAALGCWTPGEWQLTTIMSDPVSYRLTIPAFRELTANLTGDFHIPSVEAYNDAAIVRNIIQKGTGTIRLGRRPRQWAEMWNGKTNKKEGYDGLASMLLDTSKTEEAPNSDKRYVVVAEWLQDQLANIQDDAETPDAHGVPVRLRDGSIWLRESVVWDGALQTRKFDREQIKEFKQRIGLAGKDAERIYPHRGGNRKTYLVLQPNQVNQINSLVEGVSGNGKQSPL